MLTVQFCCFTVSVFTPKDAVNHSCDLVALEMKTQGQRVSLLPFRRDSKYRTAIVSCGSELQKDRHS
jgi:hypothetical protein